MTIVQGKISLDDRGCAYSPEFYLAIEGFPLQASDIKTFLSLSLKAEAEELAAKWPTLTPGVHRLTFDEGRVVLDLYFMPSSAAVKKLSGAFDAFYPDGFSPKKNPEMWEPRLLKAICSHAREGATLATWCVASAVRKAFTEAGFTIQKVPGHRGRTCRFGGGLRAGTPRRPSSGRRCRSRRCFRRLSASLGRGACSAFR